MGKTKTFESALSRLEDIVTIMESDNVALENVVELYEESIQLNNFCKNILDDTKDKITILNKSLMDKEEK